MPIITIDRQSIEVPPGATILDAARRLGIDIPTLCHRDGCDPSTSCLVCVVKIVGHDRLVPACATRVIDGMEIESETAEVRQARRMALELLLSDHLGDCVAPCELSCPAHMDIPLMLRQIRDGDFQKAIVTIKRDLALPAVLGRVCPKPCEKGCRRASADESVAICALKAQVAEADLVGDTPYAPTCSPDSGKKVAILGAGPSGLSAAFHLLQAGHQVTLFDQQSRLGGRLRYEFDEPTLPPELLDAEIAQIVRLGAKLRLETMVSDKPSFKQIQSVFNAVLVCCGASGKVQGERWGLALANRGIQVEKETYQTNLPGVFAAGNAIRTKGLVVRSVADGKQSAAAIDAFLSGKPSGPKGQPFTVRAGRLEPAEVSMLIDQIDPWGATAGLPSSADTGTTDKALESAQRQAARCMHCDCRGRHDCRLKILAEQYDALPNRYQGTRRKLVLLRSRSGVIFEPGKCIDCGLCIQVVSKQSDLLGLTFVGRGFDVRLGVPWDESLDRALGALAAECVAACPTAALSMGTPKPASELPILNQ